MWVWFDAANFGALPVLVGRARIVEASSALATTWDLTLVLAPTVGGALAALLGPAPVLWVDAASFLASALALFRVPRAFGTRNSRPSSTVARRLRGDIMEGLRYVRRHPLIWPLTTAGFGQSLTMGAVLGLVVVYGVRQLNLADDDARVRLVLPAAYRWHRPGRPACAGCSVSGAALNTIAAIAKERLQREHRRVRGGRRVPWRPARRTRLEGPAGPALTFTAAGWSAFTAGVRSVRACKTTLLKCLGRLLRPDSGRICLDGRDFDDFSRLELAKMLKKHDLEVVADTLERVGIAGFAMRKVNSSAVGTAEGCDRQDDRARARGAAAGRAHDLILTSNTSSWCSTSSNPWPGPGLP
ncbi:MAG: hypothetical protein ACRDSM_05055 [Pseudonocardiaceae bacterium]